MADDKFLPDSSHQHQAASHNRPVLGEDVEMKPLSDKSVSTGYDESVSVDMMDGEYSNVHPTATFFESTIRRRAIPAFSIAEILDEEAFLAYRTAVDFEDLPSVFDIEDNVQERGTMAEDGLSRNQVRMMTSASQLFISRGTNGSSSTSRMQPVVATGNLTPTIADDKSLPRSGHQHKAFSEQPSVSGTEEELQVIPLTDDQSPATCDESGSVLAVNDQYTSEGPNAGLLQSDIGCHAILSFPSADFLGDEEFLASTLAVDFDDLPSMFDLDVEKDVGCSTNTLAMIGRK